MGKFLKHRKNLFYLAWVQALAGVFGSLYFSEFAHYQPCVLCWWQRILLYPLVIIIAVGILKDDEWLPYYVLPFSVLGLGVSFYQNLIQYGVISDPVQVCSTGVSCAARYIDWFGFVTIPFLSLIAFTVITALMMVALRKRV